MGHCHKEGCKNKTTITLRIETDKGSDFVCFYKKHLFIASALIKDISDNLIEDIQSDLEEKE